MKTLIHRTALLAMVVLASCSTEDGAGTSPKDTNLILQLEETRWSLATCTSNPYIIINGFNECEYLDYLNFSNSQVYIRPKDAAYIATHHICYVVGNKMVISIQECSNTTWRALFELSVVSIDGNTMSVDVTSSSIAPEYKERFEYNRL